MTDDLARLVRNADNVSLLMQRDETVPGAAVPIIGREPRRAPCVDRTMAQPARILVVDDKPDVLEAIHDQLTARGYDVHSVLDPASASGFLTPALTDVAVLDVGTKGLRLAREAASQNLPCILISGRPVVIEMGGLGEILQKPFRSDELIARIERRLRDVGVFASSSVS